jgi:PadR family transcriptional regulator, regulatory protein PadR
LEDSQSDLQQGMLELLTLKTLALEPMHGWGIARRIQQASRQVFQINQGSLYPALHRLEMEGSIDSEWRESEHHRHAKSYRLTAKGRRQLAAKEKNWERVAMAVSRILQTS